MNKYEALRVELEAQREKVLEMLRHVVAPESAGGRYESKRLAAASDALELAMSNLADLA